MPIPVGEKVGPYEILSLIGVGGMGEVYCARDPRVNRTVAIKFCGQRFRPRFEMDTWAVATFVHPRVCQIYDVGPNYLVLEYVEGRTLTCPQPLDEAVRRSIQIAEALEQAHSRGYYHRNLRPDNIVITADDRLKLHDFGLTNWTAEGGPKGTKLIAGTVLGTAGYLAPEQAAGKPIDKRVDMFALGIVLYEMISGKYAFIGSSAADAMNSVMRVDPPQIEAPEDILKILRKCLEKHPADRFQDMAEVRVALEEFAAKPKPPAPGSAEALRALITKPWSL